MISSAYEDNNEVGVYHFHYLESIFLAAKIANVPLAILQARPSNYLSLIQHQPGILERKPPLF